MKQEIDDVITWSVDAVDIIIQGKGEPDQGAVWGAHYGQKVLKSPDGCLINYGGAVIKNKIIIETVKISDESQE